MGGNVVSTTFPYKPLAHIDNGTFGDVYQGVDVDTGAPVAIKVERIAKTKARKRMLEKEQDVYDRLQGHAGIPNVLCRATTPEGEPVMVMEFLGPSLETLFRSKGGKFSVANCMNIAIQCIRLLHTLHTFTPYVHGDIKPNNFLIGRGSDHGRVYMIDYGLAKLYRHPTTDAHLPCSTKNGISGTARYISLNVHEGINQSRRDDLESLLYMLLYFIKRRLPWQGHQTATKKEKYAFIHAYKRDIDPESLFAYVPQCFRDMYAYVRKLQHGDTPDYRHLQRIFTEYAGEHSIELTACTLSTLLP